MAGFGYVISHDDDARNIGTWKVEIARQPTRTFIAFKHVQRHYPIP